MSKLRRLTFLLISSIFVIFALGCQSMNQFSPEKVIANALDSNDSLTFYGEADMSFSGIPGLDDIKVKEWRKENKFRLDMTTETETIQITFDGESALIVNESEKTAFLTMLANEMDKEELKLNPRDEIESLLRMVQNTHEVETVGEETIIGREAVHMKATKKEGEKTFYGDLELWIDKENWLLLKIVTKSGDVQVNMEYTKIDFDVDIDEHQLELEVPEDIEVQEIGNISDDEQEISLEEVPEKLGKQGLYIPENEEHKIERISFIDITGPEFSYKDVTIDYKRNDGMPLMSLTLLDAGEYEEISGEERKALANIGEFVQIRNIEGHFIDEELFRNVSWTEDGINYSIHVIDPNVTLEEIQIWAEQMEEIK